MVSTYVAILIFAVIAILEPLLMILSSKLIRRKSRPNRVKDNSYESAEESAGTRASVMNEYLHYFPMFLSFEIVVAIMLIWVVTARLTTGLVNYAILGLFVFSFIFELFVIILAKRAKD
jgi:NADH:ubiquinone oxidoreductase subunit 3 (subunit A)